MPAGNGFPVSRFAYILIDGHCKAPDRELMPGTVISTKLRRTATTLSTWI